MENTFLPGIVRQRLADLMKYHKVFQTDFALKIGCNDSLLSRFLTGKTDKIGNKHHPYCQSVQCVHRLSFGCDQCPRQKEL